jgi:hypothetical protein
MVEGSNGGIFEITQANPVVEFDISHLHYAIELVAETTDGTNNIKTTNFDGGSVAVFTKSLLQDAWKSAQKGSGDFFITNTVKEFINIKTGNDKDYLVPLFLKLELVGGTENTKIYIRIWSK